jgi:hypothetical protein
MTLIIEFSIFQDSEYHLKNNEKEVPGPNKTAFESIELGKNTLNDEESNDRYIPGTVNMKIS